MNMENPQLSDEIKNQVLTENTAQGVLNHLKALESNRARMRTRWVWELLQNARDTSATSVFIEHSHGEIIFRHDGTKFAIDEVAHLIYHGSTKFENEETIGQYGSGFLTTHLLSPTIEVSGQLNNGQFFEFCLKREVGSVKALSESMEYARKDFNDSLSVVPQADGYTTQFRYPIENDATDAVEYGIAMLQRCAPFVVVFNEVFSCIAIKSSNKITSFEVPKPRLLLQDGLRKISVSENRNGNQQDRVYLLAEGEKTSVAIPLKSSTEDEWVCLPVNDIPKLFLGFPLIGTENFSFPAVINSFAFTPTEDRDGVYLGQAENEVNHENEAVIEEACGLLIDLVQFVAEAGWRNVYELVNVPTIRQQNWLKLDWLRETLKEQFIGKIRQTLAVLCELGPIAPKKSILPFAEEDADVKTLWDLLYGLEEFRQKLTRRNEAVGWCKAIKSWAAVHEGDPMSLFDEARDGQKLALYIDEETRKDEDSDWGAIKDLQNLLREDIEAVEWLNQLHDFLNKNGLHEAVSEYHIVLDQDGFLDKLSNLHRDQDIAEELKDIAKLLKWEVRQKLRDRQISALDRFLGKGAWDTEYVRGELIRRLQKHADESPDKNFAKASVGLFAWIVGQKGWDLLRDFPVFAKKTDDDNWRVIKLKRGDENSDQPLAPVGAWTNDLQPYWEFFPRRYIIADDFFQVVPDLDIWQTLDDKGFLKKDVIVTKNVYFRSFLPDESLTDDEEHETNQRVPVTNIAFLTRDDIGIMARVRQNQRLACTFWRFLTEWLILNDPKGLKINEALCGCENPHKYYPAEWLVPLVENKWVPVGNRKSDKATAKSLADMLRGSGWKPNSLNENPDAVKLLKAIGVTQFDLTREFVAENPETRQELDNAFTDILATSAGNISYLKHAREYIKALKNNEDLPKVIESHQRQKQRVQENQNLGQLVERLVRESLESESFAVKREPIGSDFEIEHDSIEDEEEMGIELSRENQSWLVEVKATRSQEIRMTATQARKAVEQGDRFLLCVVPVDSGNTEPELDIVRVNMRFVKNIGNRVDRLCNNLDGFEELRDDITADESSGVQLEVVSGTARIRVASSVWKNDGFPLKDLARVCEISVEKEKGESQ